MYIKSSRIYMEDGIKSGYLHISAGKFEDFTTEKPCEEPIIDYGDLKIIPGIFDTHNHGTCGYTLEGVGNEEENRKNVYGYLKGCASQGITSIFPTAELGLFRIIAQIAEEKPAGAEICGIHSEGPWLNRVGEKGVRKPYPPVSLETAKKMVEDGQGWLKLVSLAPEIPGIMELTEYFLKHGITVGAAHSDNQYHAAMEAYNKGISVSTHTGNVMTDMHHRDIGGLGAALTNDNVMCEVICDSLHICNEMLDIYFRIKDYKYFMMISDCTAYSGAPTGSYRPGYSTEKRVVTKEGFLLSDTGRLCGSTQPVLFGIKNLVENVGLPLETVLRMSSLNPAVKYGFGDKKGSIRKGKNADFVVLDDAYQVKQTFVSGRKVYDLDQEGKIYNYDFLIPWE